MSGVSRRELHLLAGAVVLGLAIRIAFLVITKGHTLAGDEPEYDLQARFIADGRWFWSDVPYGIPGPSIWKAPGYPMFVGLGYILLGEHPDRFLAAQVLLLSPVTIVLTWMLARRLFDARVAAIAAFAAAAYPFIWHTETRFFSEALAVPLFLGVMVLLLDRPEASYRRAAAAGALAGLTMLTRPATAWLLLGAAAALALAGSDRRRGLVAAAICVTVAALTVAPWTARNHRVTGSFVPISVQDAALYGVFNDDSASDPKYPWAWRPVTRRDIGLFDRARPLPLPELRSRLRENAFDYIAEHPSSVPKAFFWNGLSRLWDIRRPARTLIEPPFEGRTKGVTAVGLGIYWLLLPLALAGLWIARRRRALVIPVLAMVLGASVVHTTDAGTRYRAPFEPLIVLFASSSAAALLLRRTT